jgi:hypothetical protein
MFNQKSTKWAFTRLFHMHMSDTIPKFSVVATFPNLQHTEEQFVKAYSNVFVLPLYLSAHFHLQCFIIYHSHVEIKHVSPLATLLHYTLRKVYCNKYFTYFDYLLHTTSEGSRLNVRSAGFILSLNFAYLLGRYY